MLPILYLVITGEPLLYRWIIRERVRPCYRRLRRIEQQLRAEASLEELRQLRDEIESIDGAADRLRFPGRYAESLFTLKVHINLVRTRVAGRIADLTRQSEIARTR